MNSSVFLLCASLLAVCSAMVLPTYIKPCKRSDPEFSKCAVERGNEVISRITEGDAAYGIPVLDPLKTTNFNISSIQLLTRTDELVDSKVFTKHLKVICNYSLSGILLKHNIDGSGVAEMEFYNVSIPIHVALTKSDRAEYISVQDATAKVVPEKVTFNTTHFNGDLKTLKLAEKSANANWKDMMGILSPILDKLLTTAVKKTADAFFNNIPLNLIFV
ncbi:hypothetical protein WA026_002003 [Henosepilachna vigintioctopunctata]|uniref:Uncharacterized protein n=1 Tax=Henosepilachna vigintioctopunctata TaxID=420089 RepID=A0AAW1ULY7_9CUCU